MLEFKRSSDMVSRSEKRRKRKKAGVLKIILIVFAAVIFLYLAAGLYSALSSNLATTVALGGSVTEDVRASGYVFRQQSVIDAPWSGHFESLVSEGERVKEGQVLGYIYQTRPDSSITERIKKIHRMLRLSGMGGEAILSSAGTGVIEKNISELARDLSDMRQNCNLADALSKKEEINVIIKRKNNTGVQEENMPSETEQLRTELSNLEIQAGESVRIIAPTGGVFSSRIDGLEDMLAYENSETIVPSYIEELDKTEALSLQTAEAGQPLCKVINNYVWRYATVISEKEAENIKLGQTVQMLFYDLASGFVEGTVSYMSETQGGKCAIVISTNKFVDGIYSTSKINADIVTVNSSGIKLPADCLRVKDGEMGVYVIRLDEAKFVPINLIYKNEDWAIVSAAEPELGGARLQLYDEVIVECRNLEDGKIVR